MNFKEITSSISEAEDIPAGKVRKVAKAFVQSLNLAIENGEKLQLPGLIFNPRTTPARQAEGDKPARPERKFALIRTRPIKSDSTDLQQG